MNIAGIGFNVNQEQWVNGAPNPVSIKQLTGVKADIDAIAKRFEHKLETTLSWEPVQLRNYYRVHHYRCNGYWPFVEREVSTTPTMNATAGVEGQFLARIEGFLPTGELLLRDQQGNLRKYHFKQVRYVL